MKNNILKMLMFSGALLSGSAQCMEPQVVRQFDETPLITGEVATVEDFNYHDEQHSANVSDLLALWNNQVSISTVTNSNFDSLQQAADKVTLEKIVLTPPSGGNLLLTQMNLPSNFFNLGCSGGAINEVNPWDRWNAKSCDIRSGMERGGIARFSVRSRSAINVLLNEVKKNGNISQSEIGDILQAQRKSNSQSSNKSDKSVKKDTEKKNNQTLFGARKRDDMDYKQWMPKQVQYKPKPSLYDRLNAKSCAERSRQDTGKFRFERREYNDKLSDLNRIAKKIRN